VRTIKESCLDRVILVGEPSLRGAIHEFVEHYHRETKPSGREQPIALPGDEDDSWRPPDCVSSAVGWTTEVLPPSCRVERTRAFDGPGTRARQP
jgi:hypothetical protein